MNNSAESNQNIQTDRYVSFCGIDCDLKADKLMAMLEAHLEAGSGEAKWINYFQQKRAQQLKNKQDNLNFIGHQTNTLYEYFELCQDQEASKLLYQIEQECC